MTRRTLGMRGLLLVACGAALAAAAAPARADLAGGRDKLLHGDYAGARADAERVRGADRAAARLLVARVARRTGDYVTAEREARGQLRAKDQATADDAQVLLAEVLRDTGRLADARRQLEELHARSPQQLRGRYVLGLVYRDLGERELAEKTFDSFVDDWNNEKIDPDGAEPLMYVALASRYTSSYEDANDTFRDAVARDPNLLEANLEWGSLFLEKYAAGYAEQSFDEVLKIDPHEPDAHVGMARTKLEQTYDVVAAQRHIDQALHVNPRHVPALLVRAELQIDFNDWDGAAATLAAALAVNPNSLDAHALLATMHWLRDDTAGYEAEKKKAFAVNPRWAPLYHVVATSAVREHRYVEAIALEEEAVALDPKYFAAMEAIGTGYLRLGQEEKGIEWLRRAWEGDQYNVRTFNMLDLFEEVIPKEYVFVPAGPFKLRYQVKERKILERFVPPVLQRAYADMVKRYGFTPTGPIAIELFQNPQHYSVRTVGLPNLGALGVCFGQVITALSPSSGDVNWGMVLWHELAHVFAIQLSNERVPRWFTEGLSEYETVIAKPEWRRENDLDVWMAMSQGTLPSVADLNAGFMKPEVQDVVVAYYLSSLAIEFIAKTYGFPKIVDALRLYGKGLETPAVLEKITGLGVPQFDAAFRAWLDKRLAVYKDGFRLPTVGFEDVAKVEAAAAAAPTDAGAQARLGLAYYYAADAAHARPAFERALALDAKNHIALFCLAELALHERDIAGAAKLYGDLLAAGGDGYDVRLRLGQIAIETDDVAAAETHLARAKQLDPERSEPYFLLADLYDKKGRAPDSLAQLERYVTIEQMQYAPVKRLIDGYSRMARWDKVREYADLAVQINPFDGELHLAIGRAFLQGGQADRALASYDSALLAEPPLRRPALAHVGRARALAAKKNVRAAQAAVAAALKLEPDNPDALALRRQLGHK